MATNIVDLVRHDHRRVEDLFERIAAQGDERTRLRLFRDLAWEFEAHAAAEEEVLYPAATKLPDLPRWAKYATKEHDQVRDLFDELHELGVDEDQWQTTLLALQTAIAGHVAEEEATLLPALRRHLTSAELVTLAEQFDAAKAKVAKAS